MSKRLIITRHGNTFLPDQIPTRVGRGTDLPLVEEKRGRAIGKYLMSKNIVLNKAYAAPLKRTIQTTRLVLDEMKSSLEIIESHQFSEIDYGPDENKTEEEVLYRLGNSYVLNNSIICDYREAILQYGKQIIDKWDLDGTVPKGWSVDVDSIIKTWLNFANSIVDNETVFLCSSNGIIRFAPYILDIPYEQFCQEYDIKVATGGVSIFENISEKWICKEWNTKAYNL